MTKLVLDACCGARMFWFDKANPLAVFVDKRKETLIEESLQGRRQIVIAPDVVADFTKLPFADGSFALVVFDPPHLLHPGENSRLAKKYGKLKGDWRDELRKGFSECFRVLKPTGVLIFKWNENDIPVSTILALTDEKPLFGNRCGKQSKSHWIVFMKPDGDSNSNPSLDRKTIVKTPDLPPIDRKTETAPARD